MAQNFTFSRAKLQTVNSVDLQDLGKALTMRSGPPNGFKCILNASQCFQ